jgi:hypothetical protein
MVTCRSRINTNADGWEMRPALALRRANGSSFFLQHQLLTGFQCAQPVREAEFAGCLFALLTGKVSALK